MIKVISEMIVLKQKQKERKRKTKKEWVRKWMQK